MLVIDPAGPLSDVVAKIREVVDSNLTALVEPGDPPELYDPVRYVLTGGGKRLRPVIVVLTAHGFGVDTSESLPAALATEVFHNFTLVHDDIMDHSDERRGRPTVHRKWNEDVAILAGDYLMSLAYELLAKGPSDSLPEVMRVFGEMVRQLCEGQTLDKSFETRRDVTVSDYFAMIDAKTGALLRACLELGGVLGGASDDERTLLREAGVAAGRAFQMQDDLLDVVAEDDRWGKMIGGDLVAGKRTYLLLRCLEKLDGEARSWFQRIIGDGGLEPGLVPEARDRMAAGGIIEDARAEIHDFTREAADRLGQMAATRNLGHVADLISGMMARGH